MSIIRNGIQSADLDVPVVLPTLNLDFANSQELDPRITFTRGSIGTFVNKNGLIETAAANIPRFDYDPVTGECKGLLIEESRQNLLTYSEDFSNAAWSKSQSSIITTSIIALNGSTAYKLVENTVGNVGHYINQGSITKSSNAVLTFTLFAKAAERQYLGLVINSASTGFGNRYGAEFNLRNGTASEHDPAQGTYSSGSFSIEKYPNDWYKCRITCTTSTDAQSQVRIFVFRDTNQWTSAAAYQGDGTSGIYVWGAQLETGAFPTSYIPTSGSTVTRSADNASMIGSNFSSWYNSSEGTIFCSYSRYQNTKTLSFLYEITSQYSGTYFDYNRFGVYANPTNEPRIQYFGGISNNIMDTSGAYGVLPINTTVKFASRYKQGDLGASRNGSQSTGNAKSSKYFTTPNFGQIYIGTSNNTIYGAAPHSLCGTIKKFTYYPKALSNTQLQYLTQ